MVAPYSIDCAATKQIQIYKNRLNRRLLLNFKILRSLKIFRGGDRAGGALYFLWAVAGALRAEFLSAKNSVAAKLEVAQASRDIYLWRVEISRRRLK